MPHVITRPGGDYLSPYGWTKNRKTAFQFRTKGEAQAHAEHDKLVGALTEFVPEEPPPGTDPNGAATIFGYGKPSQHG